MDTSTSTVLSTSTVIYTGVAVVVGGYIIAKVFRKGFEANDREFRNEVLTKVSEYYSSVNNVDKYTVLNSLNELVESGTKNTLLSDLLKIDCQFIKKDANNLIRKIWVLRLSNEKVIKTAIEEIVAWENLPRNVRKEFRTKNKSEVFLSILEKVKKEDV